MTTRLLFVVSAAALAPSICAFTAPSRSATVTLPIQSTSTHLFSSQNNEVDDLGEKFGGFTTKQRLREEIESPFRKVRLAFFSFSAVSAFVALYFSALVSIDVSATASVYSCPNKL